MDAIQVFYAESHWILQTLISLAAVLILTGIGGMWYMLTEKFLIWFRWEFRHWRFQRERRKWRKEHGL